MPVAVVQQHGALVAAQLLDQRHGVLQEEAEVGILRGVRNAAEPQPVVVGLSRQGTRLRFSPVSPSCSTPTPPGTPCAPFSGPTVRRSDRTATSGRARAGSAESNFAGVSEVSPRSTCSLALLAPLWSHDECADQRRSRGDTCRAAAASSSRAPVSAGVSVESTDRGCGRTDPGGGAGAGRPPFRGVGAVPSGRGAGAGGS